MTDGGAMIGVAMEISTHAQISLIQVLSCAEPFLSLAFCIFNAVCMLRQ